jgi:hypothetical protein
LLIKNVLTFLTTQHYFVTIFPKLGHGHTVVTEIVCQARQAAKIGAKAKIVNAIPDHIARGIVDRFA